MEGEGDKLVIAAKNLDLIHKAVIGLEAQVESLNKELETVKANLADEESAEPDPVA